MPDTHHQSSYTMVSKTNSHGFAQTDVFLQATRRHLAALIHMGVCNIPKYIYTKYINKYFKYMYMCVRKWQVLHCQPEQSATEAPSREAQRLLHVSRLQ